MNHKKSVRKNYIYNLFYQLLLIIIPIITTPYLSRTIGPSGNGIYGYTISFVTYFILFGSLGISLYGQREIAYNQNNKEKQSKIFFELVILKFITMLISAIVFFLIFCRNGSNAIYFRILLIEMLANTLDISWFFQGLEEFKKITIRNFIIKTISVISIFIFVKTPQDVSKYLLIYVLSTLFGSLALWLGLKKYIVKPKKIKFIYHLPLIISLFIPQIAIQIYTVLDKTMIGAILNDMNEVGYYEQSQKIIKILLTIITSLGTVMLPRLASSFSKKNYELIKQYMYKTFNFIFLLAFPLMFGIIVVANNFAPLFFGDGYEKVPLIMQILSVLVVFISMSGIIGMQFLLSTKRQKELTISVIIGACVNFIFNLILITSLKSTGAAIATAIAELSVTTVQLFFIRKDFKIIDILKLSKNYLIASIVMFIACYLVDYFIVEELLGLILQVAIGGIIYLMVLIILKDQFLYKIYNENIKSIFKIRRKNNS